MFETSPEDLNTYIVLLGPLAAAWAAGSIIGLEREYHGHPAGFRNHALVCLASALLTLVMTQDWDWIGVLPLDSVRADPTRVVEAIMTGIGFLGAGVIFREGLAVRGLTTAASIWITAVLGILYGLGYWLPAVLGTLAVLVTLAVFQRLEYWFPQTFVVRQTLRFAPDAVPARAALDAFMAAHGFSIDRVSHALVDGGRTYEYRITAATRSPGNVDALAAALNARADIREFDIAPRGE